MGAERDIINAVGRNVRTIIKWTGLGLFQIGFWFGGGFGAGKVIIPCYDNFCASLGPLPIKNLFPVSCVSYFGLDAASLYRAVLDALTPVSCQINTDLFMAPSLLII